jgi:methanogenic corrinoid protein MtbC1
MNDDETPRGPSGERLAMLAALVDGDVSLAVRLASSLLAGGLPFDELSADILSPVQQDVGRRWAEGDLTIAEEHAASAAVEELIVRVGATMEPSSGPAVVVTTAESDLHALGGRVVATALALDGFRVRFLGTSVPPSDLADFLDAQAPFALVLSCSLPAAIANASCSIAAAHEQGVPVLAGGRALVHEERAVKIGADAHGVTPRDVVAILQAWQDAPPSHLAPVPDPVPERAAFARRAPLLIAAALSDVVLADGRDRMLAEELDRLCQVLEGGLLLADDGMVREHIEWLRVTGPMHGVPLASLNAALDALALAMDDDALRRAEAMLRRALG